jgi:hypothetical protein
VSCFINAVLCWCRSIGHVWCLTFVVVRVLWEVCAASIFVLCRCFGAASAPALSVGFGAATILVLFLPVGATSAPALHLRFGVASDVSASTSAFVLRLRFAVAYALSASMAAAFSKFFL